MKTIDLSGIATKSDPKKTTHPTLNPDAELSALMEQFVIVNPQFKTLKAQQETLARQIAAKAKAVFWTKFDGIALASTCLVETTRGIAKLIFKNAYSKKLNEWPILEAAIGKEKAARYFRVSTTLEFAIDALPESEQEACANAMIELARERGWLAAVSGKQFIAPRAGFHDARTTALTAEENERLDSVLPITAFPMF